MSSLGKSETMIYVKIFHEAKNQKRMDNIIQFQRENQQIALRTYYNLDADEEHVHCFIDVPITAKDPYAFAIISETDKILVILETDNPKSCVFCDEICLIKSTGECGICLKDLLVEEECIRMRCGHIMHTPCSFRWLKDHNTCPICRSNQMDKVKLIPVSPEMPDFSIYDFDSSDSD